MDKHERLQAAYDYLLEKGLVKTQKEFSEYVKVSRAQVSSAMTGNPKYLTDSYLRKICRAFPFISNKWLIKGEGEMLKEEEKEVFFGTDNTSPAEDSDIVTFLKERVEWMEKQLEEARTLLDNKTKEYDRLNEDYIKLLTDIIEQSK